MKAEDVVPAEPAADERRSSAAADGRLATDSPLRGSVDALDLSYCTKLPSRGTPMRRLRHRSLPVVALVALVAVLAGCGGDDSSTATDSTGTDSRRPPPRARASAPERPPTCLPRCARRGKLTVSTDAAYPPQSALNEQTGQYEGFDIDVATEIAKRLGVAPPGRHPPGRSSRPGAGTVAGT